jgi:benzoyl-CoA reductase/2-hydroxyglutaryl-CoA dehydratase subunit BcrC/BadD/HgdB
MTTIEGKKNRIEKLIRTCRMVSRMNRSRPDGMKSEQLYYQMLEKYFTRVMEAKEEGGFVASHSVFFPVEILYAMGITPLHNEVSTWTMAMLLGDQTEYLTAGSEIGLASEICTAHRGLSGAYHLGVLPRPDVVLWSNLICDNTTKCGELLMDMNHCPGYFVDHPFGSTPIEEKYLVNEYKELVTFLQEKSGRKLDLEKLSQGVAEMDKQIKLQVEISELRKAVPSPLHSRRFHELLTVDYMYAGQPEETEYLETLRDDLTAMVKQGKGAVNPEKFRMMTFFIPPIYLIGFLESISQEFGAASVVEPLFTYWKYSPLDPSRPLESAAKKSFLIPETRTMYGPFSQETLQDVVDCARDYKIDGAIYYAFMSCRHTCATIKVFKDLLNTLDIPMLTLDCDIMDPTINSEVEVHQKMEQFFELLEDR